MDTMINRALEILKLHPEGMLFTDLYGSVCHDYDFDEIQYSENKADFYNDVNEDNNFVRYGDKWFLRNQIDHVIKSRVEKKTSFEITNTSDFIKKYSAALNEEISHAYLSKKKYVLEDGRRQGVSRHGYYYVFDTSEELNIVRDTSITIYLEDRHFFGSVISCDETSIALESSENLGEVVESIEISTNSTFLIKKFVAKLEKLDKDHPIVRALINDGKKQLTYGDIVKGQYQALLSATNNPITFIWGPPGTGKTQTLANIALSFIEQGKRVLMISYSNVSVDGAVHRVWQNKKGPVKPGTILRYGYPRDESLRDSKTLNSYQYVLSNDPVNYERFKELTSRRKTVEKKSEERIEIDEELKRIQDKFKDDERRAISKALFVATTVTKAIIDDAIFPNSFDCVLFDEASMAYVPQVVYSASFAKSHFVCLGDYQQLPAIAIMKDSILMVDIFEYVGISQAVKERRNHKWLVMLNEQHRMDKDIASFVSEEMYFGLLETSDDVEAKVKQYSDLAPLEKNPFVFVDLSRIYSLCTKTYDSSYVNALSAFVSVSIAYKLPRNVDIGIITPYNAQARLITSMLKSLKLTNVKCATVHQFQGSEKPVIIFDAVDCYVRPYVNELVMSNRLINVALSRAEGKFIFVGHKEYFDLKVPQIRYVLYDFLRFADKSRFVINDERIFNYIQNSDADFKCLPAIEANFDYMNDLKDAKQYVSVNLGGQFASLSVEKEFFEQVKKLREHKVIVEILVHKDTRISKQFEQYVRRQNWVMNTVTLIDNKIVWFGKPSHFSCFLTKNDAEEFVGLNPAFRIGSYTALKSLAGFLGIELPQQKEIKKNQTTIERNCPMCGKKLVQIDAQEVICVTKDCGYSERVQNIEVSKNESKVLSLYVGDEFDTCKEYKMAFVESKEWQHDFDYVTLRNTRGRMKTVYCAKQVVVCYPRYMDGIKELLSKEDFYRLTSFINSLDSLDTSKQYVFLKLVAYSSMERNVKYLGTEPKTYELKELL